MITRREIRLASAEYLNSLCADELFNRFEITRVARIDTLDSIGLPVYSVSRPASKCISVSAGKSRDPMMARAGAIAEGIEFYTFENPRGPVYIETDLPSVDSAQLSIMIESGFWPLSLESTWTPQTPIATEDVTTWVSGKPINAPSDMVWLVRRNKYFGEHHFQTSSNGQALGGTFEDAFLSGLYECVERDQTVLRMCSEQMLHVWPPRVEIPEALSPIGDRIKNSSLKLFLFHCNVDIPIPCYWSILADPFGGCGTFGGWGCDLSPLKAAERAILEAIQSRAVFISGARDDIERRNFEQLKAKDPLALIQTLESLPVTGVVPDWFWGYDSLEDELKAALQLLGPWRDNIVYRHIDLGQLHAVKVLILGLEQPIMPYWKSTRWEKLREAHCG